MELYLDTANVAEVERLAHFPDCRRHHQALWQPAKNLSGMCCQLQNAIGEEGTLFAQTMSRDAKGMVEEAAPFE